MLRPLTFFVLLVTVSCGNGTNDLQPDASPDAGDDAGPDGATLDADEVDLDATGDDASDGTAEAAVVGDADGVHDADLQEEADVQTDSDVELDSDADDDSDEEEPTEECTIDIDCDDGLICTTDWCDDGQCATSSSGECDWPAEGGGAAINLTHLGGTVFDNEFHSDLSGAVWNPVTRTLWICRNNGPSKVWALVEGGDGTFSIDESGGALAEWEDFGDLEGITQADFAETHVVYVIREDAGHVQEYDLSVYGVASLVNDWDHQAVLGTSGPEGITFVPDSFLEDQGFVDGAGDPYVSTQGMGGLMFIGHQGGGYLFVFDLNRETGESVYVGRFLTSATESSGLEFDRSTGALFLWHDDDFDQLEVTRLSSSPAGDERQLDSSIIYGPMPWIPFTSRNHEGIAIASIEDCDGDTRNFWLTTDGGTIYSLLMFTLFPC